MYYHFLVEARIAAQSPAGGWDVSEEERLIQIMHDLGEDGRLSDGSGISWKKVEARMECMRSAQQCRNKWCVPIPDALVELSIYVYRVDCLYPRLQRGGKTPCWTEMDSCILVHKYMDSLARTLQN